MAQVRDITINLTPPNVSPTITLDPNDIIDVRVEINENGQSGLYGDNWDIGGLQLRLTNPLQQVQACVVELSGNGGCSSGQPSCNGNGTLADTTDTGIARLSENVDTHGQGTSATFLRGQGCSSWNAGPAAQPYDTFTVIIDTSDDDLTMNSVADLKVFDGVNMIIPQATVQIHASGAQKFDNNTEHLVLGPASLLSDANVKNFTLGLSNSGNDEWHINSIYVLGQNASMSDGQETCLARIGGPIVLNQNTSVFPFARNNCQ